MIGDSKILKSTEPDKNVWGHFNGCMSSAYLVILEELTEKKTTEFDGIIKELITGGIIQINQKGEKPYSMKSFHKFISASNTTPIKTIKGDRRNFIVQASNELIGNQEYFKQLRQYTKDKRIQQIFHERITSDDTLENFKSEIIPLTEYQKTLQNANRSEYDLFLEHYVRQYNTSTIREVQSNDLYQLFKEWIESNGYDYKVTSTKFVRNIKLLYVPINSLQTSLNDPTLHRRDANYIRINISILKTYYELN